MTSAQADKANRFRALHEGPGTFVIANVWDAGSARMMAALGFPALATSSAGAAEAARKLSFPFMLTGRCENFLRGRVDLEDTIRRLNAYAAAGANVLMAPGLPDLAAVRAVCAAVGKPFNFMAGIKGKSFTVADLAAAGVKRVSLAASLYRAAMTAAQMAAAEVRDNGTFGYLDTSLSAAEMNAFLED